MALTRGVLGQQDVAGAEHAPAAVTDLDLEPACENDDVLTFGRIVPLVVVVTAGVTEDQAGELLRKVKEAGRKIGDQVDDTIDSFKGKKGSASNQNGGGI